MSRGKDENILRAIDGIELGNNAQQRMYENILKKAERKSKSVRYFRIVKPAVSLAACVCLVISAALLLRLGVNNSDSFASGGADMSMNKSGANGAAAADLQDTSAEWISGTFDIADYYAEEAEGAYDGSSYTETVTPIDGTFAESTSIITTTFEFITEDVMNDGADANTAAPGNAVIFSDTSVVGAESFDFEQSIAAEAPETVGKEVAEVSSVKGETAQITFYTPLGPDFTPNAVTADKIPADCTSVIFSDGLDTSQLSSVDFTYNKHFYTVIITPPVEVTDTSDTVFEEISEYSDSKAVIFYSEYDGGTNYRVYWRGKEYDFLLVNDDGAEKEDIIEVSAMVIEMNT